VLFTRAPLSMVGRSRLRKMESAPFRNTETSSTVLGAVHHGWLAGEGLGNMGGLFDKIIILPSPRVLPQAGYPHFPSPSSTVSFLKTLNNSWLTTAPPKRRVSIR
jgi:hypothetical protein